MWKLCWDTIHFLIWISNIGYFKEGRKEWFVPKVVPMNKTGGTPLFCGPAKNLDRVSLSHLWKFSFFSKYIPPLVLVNQSVTLQFCRAAWTDDMISSSSDERIWSAVAGVVEDQNTHPSRRERALWRGGAAGISLSGYLPPPARPTRPVPRFLTAVVSTDMTKFPNPGLLRYFNWSSRARLSVFS